MSVTHRPLTPDDILLFKAAGDAHLSPDGRRVAYVVSSIDADADETRSAIWIVPLDGGPPVQFTGGARRDTAPRWAPDGRRLAFLSDRDGGAPQLYVMPADGGEARQITSLPGGAGVPVWSPDGERLLFAARVAKEAAPTEAAAAARWPLRPKVVRHAQYKADGQGYTYDAVSHLFVVPAEGGAAVQISDGEGGYLDPAWSPDGERVAAARLSCGVADYNMTDIWLLDADGGNAHLVLDLAGRALAPSWSPDGALLACYGTDEPDPGLGESVSRVWVVGADGTHPRALTAGHDRSVFLPFAPALPMPPIWSTDGQHIYAIFGDSGCHHLRRVSLEAGAVETVVGGDRQLMSADIEPTTGRLVFAASDLLRPPELYTADADGGNERRLTTLNDEVLAGLELPRVERRDFFTPYGHSVEGWVILPMNADGPAPLLVDIHGGPHSYHGALMPVSRWYTYVLASRGWAVLALNPTGSGSYGQAFAHGIRGRWGEYDLAEQMAAVDALVAEGLADPDRLAVAGYSYGGYMTSYVITHTPRFKAAVVGAPVVNLESFFGTSDIGLWFGPWEMGSLPDSTGVFRRLSPVNYLSQVTTPTLVLHGEADDRCPIGQGEELFIGLVAAGRVPTEFVRYPGGSHLFVLGGRPSHRVDYHRRLIDWIERYTLGRDD